MKYQALKEAAERNKHVRYYSESPELKSDMDWLAAANPATILSLIQDLEMAKESNVALTMAAKLGKELGESLALQKKANAVLRGGLDLLKEAQVHVDIGRFGPIMNADEIINSVNQTLARADKILEEK